MPNKLSHRKKSRKHNSRRTKKYNRKLKGGAGAGHVTVRGSNAVDYSVPYEHNEKKIAAQSANSSVPPTELSEIVDAPEIVDASDNNEAMPAQLPPNYGLEHLRPTAAELQARTRAHNNSTAMEPLSSKEAPKATAKSYSRVTAQNTILLPSGALITRDPEDYYVRNAAQGKNLKQQKEAAAIAAHEYESVNNLRNSSMSDRKGIPKAVPLESNL